MRWLPPIPISMAMSSQEVLRPRSNAESGGRCFLAQPVQQTQDDNVALAVVESGRCL